MYSTKEALEKDFPLGTVIAEEPIFQRFYCADEVTFEKIKNWFKGDDVQWTSPHHVMVTRMVRKTVEGYLYNGETWEPMIRDGNNWVVYFPGYF